MNRQAAVGLFTIVALVLLFGIFFVLANYGTQGRYQIGVHFKSAAGLHKGALVYESGVIVGVVAETRLLPDDFTVDVICGINNSVDVPRNAKFVIEAPLTGDSTLEIVPPLPAAQPEGLAAPTNAPQAVAVLPHEILPVAQQPVGTNPATIQDLLDQGQGEVKRLDGMLALLEKREPELLAQVSGILKNGSSVAAEANASFTKLSKRIDGLADTLQLAAQQSSANLNDLTGTLDTAVHQNTGHFDSIVASLDRSARDLNATADHINALAGDPKLKDNLLETTAGIAHTATTFSQIAGDLRQVTGNPQTQAQLRDTIAQVDAASQKANSVFARFGGKSSVYGVDAGATPAPTGSTVPNGTLPNTFPRPVGSSAPAASHGVAGVEGNVKDKLGDLVGQLVALQVRVSELDDQKASETSNSPLFSRDKGPSTDINVVALPLGKTYAYFGANDIGGPASTVNFVAMKSLGDGFQAGGGVLYSRLGARLLYSPPNHKGLGFEVREYDLRTPTTDLYGNIELGRGLELFGGERDATHASRRTVFGLQLQR
jgi:ABC-type transporter Mla subunit MlaD